MATPTSEQPSAETKDEPDSDWLPPADPDLIVDNPHEGEPEWQPLPIPEGDNDGDR